jgi:hypothetical protein
VSEIGCQLCGTYDVHEPCERCGHPIHIGSTIQCPHERAGKTHGFEPFFHVGIGKYVTGVGDINQAMRPQWNDDHITQIQHRDMPESYYREMNERRAERKAEADKERRR